jgi:16S rRNA (cytosine1402-N4)-methyltransferase
VAHRPVLLAQALDALHLREGGVYVDATFGGGGYTRAMLAAASCRIIAFDRDPDAVARGRLLAADQPALTVLHAPFGDMRDALAAIGVAAVDGIVFDLGVSSFQLDQGERGFSFQVDGPLDMRMSRNGPSAADLVNDLPEAELARLIFTLGDEPQARSIAKAIAKARAKTPLTSTGALAAVVGQAKGGRQGPRDPATRTFQALRMAVNDEMGELERGLAASETLLRPGGRLAVVSFHSGEDSAVKEFVNRHGGRQPQPSRHLPPVAFAPPRWRWVKSGVIKPDAAELAANPRARSARLRVAERLATGAGASGLDDVEGGPWPLAA